MPNVFEYTDYRQFLRDYYKERKSRARGYSFSKFCKASGIKSTGLLHDILHGKVSVPEKNIRGLAEAVKLRKKERQYFENLVAFNQTKKPQERERIYRKLISIKSNINNAWKVQEIRVDQLEYYSKLYHSAIRSLIDMHGFKNDYAWLARNVRPRIKSEQAKRSVQMLERIGLIEKQKNGYFKLTNKNIKASKEAVQVAGQRFYTEAGNTALEALNTASVNARRFACSTLGISEKTYAAIWDKICKLRQEIMEMAEKDKKADRVYHLNFQFFPLSNIKGRKK